MYGNLYVSGRVGSYATAVNHPLPANPSSSSSTRTHPQPHFPFTSSLATASLQNNRDDPHLAGNEACMCSLCHIKDRFFPRSQDGRIVLPHPTTTTSSLHPLSTRLRSSTASSVMTGATTPLANSAIPPTLRRNRTDSTASNHDLRLSVAKFNEGRRIRTPQLQSDRVAEASFTGIDRISANIEESRTSRMTDESLHTAPQMDDLEGRPFSGPSRRTQKYDHKPKRKRPEPWPRILDSEELSGQSSHLSQESSSFQVQHTSSKSRSDYFLDRHGTAHPRNLLKTPLARELSPQTINLEAPQPNTPLTAPHSYIGAYGYERRPILSPPPPPPHQGTFDVSMSSYPETPARIETSQQHHQHQHQHHLHYHSASRPESLTDIAQDQPKVIKYNNSRSKNPHLSSSSSSTDNNPTPPTTQTTIISGERSVNSSPTRESSHLLLQSQQSQSQSQSQIEDSSGSVQTQFRFQEPVVPEDSTTSPIHTRDLSLVQVKWDSERKRRQGYFAQEEGAEKSPFRHYNKADCDFES